jgi:glycerate kinase
LKIVIAPDSFKGSLSATAAAEAAGRGVLRARPDAQTVIVPLADGGEGTVEALVRATGGRILPAAATDPLGKRIESFFGVLGDGETAVVEMAAASGLPLVPEGKRNPMNTTSYGTGELIRAALNAGCSKLILGLGGSATNDGGVGMVQALGGIFKDSAGREIGRGGKELSRICLIDLSRLDPRLAKTKIIAASDVQNPLTGKTGASYIFGPQKGATAKMVEELDAGLKNLAEAIRRNLGIDVENQPGAGAAGGMGAACMAFLGAELRLGIDILLDATAFENKLQGAGLIITGEGRIDSQTLDGKTVSGVLRLARKAGVPVIALCGGVGPGGYDLLESGVCAVLSIANRPMTLAEAQAGAEELLERAAEQAIRLAYLNCRCEE